MIKNKSTTAAEDPATKAAREAEQARAEASRTFETQQSLSGQTLKRLRRFGKAVGPASVADGASGSVPLIAPSGAGAGLGLQGSSGGGFGALGPGKMFDGEFQRVVY
jgi:hypothetical protein